MQQVGGVSGGGGGGGGGGNNGAQNNPFSFLFQPNQGAQQSTTVAAQQPVVTQINAARELAVMLNPIVVMHGDGRITLGECKKILLNAASDTPFREKLRQSLTPSAIQEWLTVGDNAERRITKIIILLELNRASRDSNANSVLENGVPVERVVAESDLTLAGVSILDEIEEKHRELDFMSTNPDQIHLKRAESLTRSMAVQLNIFANLPVRVCQSIFSDSLLLSWKENVTYSGAGVLGLLFSHLDNQRKILLINIFAPATECKSHGVLKDYWCCTGLEAQAQFPEISQEEFLANLPKRTPHENLRAALRLFSHPSVQIEQILKDQRFNWSYVIENQAVFNLIIITMLFRSDSLQVSQEVHYALWNHYGMYKASRVEEALEILSALYLSMQSEHLLSEGAPQAAHNSIPVTKQDDQNRQGRFNPSYWYDNDDVNRTIDCEIGRRNLGNMRQPVRALSAVIFEDSVGLQIHLTSGLKRIQSELTVQQGVKAYTVLVPLHIHGNHWVGCILDIDLEKKTGVFRYIDPMHSNFQTQMISALQALFAQALGNHYIVEAATLLAKHAVWQQPDLCSCGPYVIANFIRYAYGEGLEHSAPSAAAIRQAHVEMIGPGFTAKQFTKPDSTPSYQLTPEKQAEYEQERFAKGRELHEITRKLNPDIREILYPFCKEFAENPEYPKLRLKMQELFDIDKALSATSDDQTSDDNTVHTKFLAVLRKVFPDITDDMTRDAVYSQIADGKFVDDLPNILGTVLQIEQKKSGRPAQ